MSLHRLLGFRVAVPDPDALGSFYDELGLTGDARSGWSGDAGGAVVRAETGSFRRLLDVEIGCSDESDLENVTARLEEGGAAVQRNGDVVTVTDPATRVRFAVALAEPEAAPTPRPLVVPNTPGATVRVDRRADAVFDGPRPPRRLGHLVIGSPDIDATRSLLVEGLGLRVSDEIPGIIAFLRCSRDHHNVAVVGAPVPMLQHYSWECDDVDHLGHAATAIYRNDPTRHTWGLGRHFAGSNFYWYLRDPAGSFVEFYSDLDQIDDDDAWERAGRTEFDLAHIANAWGPHMPPEFVAPDDTAALCAAWESLDP